MRRLLTLYLPVETSIYLDVLGIVADRWPQQPYRDIFVPRDDDPDVIDVMVPDDG